MSTRFRALVRHFFLQFFHADLGMGESTPGAFATLGILTLPGVLMCLILLGKYSSLVHWLKREFHFERDAAALPDKYTFVAFSIAVTGIVAVLRWDSLFPDRRDYVNLVPLPVETRNILLAKLTALAAFVLIFAADINLIPALLFPFIVLEDQGSLADLLRFAFAHAVAVLAAGIWAFCTALTLIGTLMAVLPYPVFRRARRYVQFGCVLVLLILFFSAPALRGPVTYLRNGTQTGVEWLPPVWFVGLYQVAQGKASGSFPALAEKAFLALPAAAVAAVAAYWLSYWRSFLRSAEMTEGSGSHRTTPAWLFGLPRRLGLTAGFDSAVLWFTLRTLMRSESHTAILAAALGTGFALAVLTATSGDPAGIFSAALIVLYSLLTGLRLSFGLPSELRANWLFRVTGESTVRPENVVRAVMFLLILPVLVISAALDSVVFSPATGVWHLIYAAGSELLLIELLTYGFRVIPFTCAWIPGRSNPVFAIAIWVVGLAVFGPSLGTIEAFVVSAPYIRVPVYLGLVSACIFALRYFGSVREPLVWTDTRGEFSLLRMGE